MNNTPVISCQFWTPPNRCAVAGKTVSPGVCRHCLANDLQGEHLKPKLRGLGDLIAAGTKAIGIQPCRGCQKRQRWFNRLSRLVVALFRQFALTNKSVSATTSRRYS